MGVCIGYPTTKLASRRVVMQSLALAATGRLGNARSGTDKPCLCSIDTGICACIQFLN